MTWKTAAAPLTLEGDLCPVMTGFAVRIAIISSGFLPVVDGVTVALHQRVRSLSQWGHQVLVLCPDYRPIASVYPHWDDYVGEILPGVRVVGLPSEPFMGVAFERNVSRQAIPVMQQALGEFQPDIIHVDEPDRLFLGMLQAPGVAYARTQGVPCAGFYHTHFIDYIEDFFPLPPPLLALGQWGSSQIIRRVFRAYDATLVSSPSAEQRLQRMGIHNTRCDRFLGVDVATFGSQPRDPQFFSTHYGLEDLGDRLKLVFLGRLTPDKGWRFTLQALSHWATHPDSAPYRKRVALIVVGDGALRQEIEASLRSLGLTVHLLGRVPPDAVPSLLANSDIHVTTSEKETLGLTVLEAFAAGIPVLAPRAGGVVTLIRDGENGRLFAPRDEESFRRSLLSLVSDAQQRQRLGQQGQRDVAPYDWSTVTRTLLKTWEALCSSPPKKPSFRPSSEPSSKPTGSGSSR